ncbi:hypothetical protein SDJN03_01590, partial [Cucurbita argyrosperma subsp. sororia]
MYRIETTTQCMSSRFNQTSHTPHVSAPRLLLRAGPHGSIKPPTLPMYQHRDYYSGQVLTVQSNLPHSPCISIETILKTGPHGSIKPPTFSMYQHRDY